MQIARRFTKEGRDPYETVGFRSAASEIRNPDGSVVFSAEGVEVPAEWSQVACDILAQKYLRKAGVPARLLAVEEDGRAVLAVAPQGRHGSARGAAQSRAAAAARPARSRCFDRLAGTWTYWGWKGGYFNTEADAQRLLRRIARHAGAPDGGAELAAMVQHRPPLGLRHRRAGAGPLLRRSRAPARCTPPTAPTSTRSRMPASSSRSPTTSSTRAASWIYGCARRGCSNTAPAPAPISRSCAATARNCRAAAARPG